MYIMLIVMQSASDSELASVRARLEERTEQCQAVQVVGVCVGVCVCHLHCDVFISGATPVVRDKQEVPEPYGRAL